MPCFTFGKSETSHIAVSRSALVNGTDLGAAPRHRRRGTVTGGFVATFIQPALSLGKAEATFSWHVEAAAGVTQSIGAAPAIQIECNRCRCWHLEQTQKGKNQAGPTKCKNKVSSNSSTTKMPPNSATSQHVIEDIRCIKFILCPLLSASWFSFRWT